MKADHTKIPIRFDPLSQRMRGTTYHGGLFFDVPFISLIEGNLFVGGCENGLILPSDFQHLVSLYPWETYKVLHKLTSKREVWVYDAGIEPLEGLLDELTDWTLSCLRTGPTLVHCQAGLNRSGLVAALVLMKEGRTAPQAIALLRTKRSPAVLCNPAFERWLLEKKD